MNKEIQVEPENTKPMKQTALTDWQDGTISFEQQQEREINMEKLK